MPIITLQMIKKKKSIMPMVAIQDSTEEFLEGAITASSLDDFIKE